MIMGNKCEKMSKKDLEYHLAKQLEKEMKDLKNTLFWIDRGNMDNVPESRLPLSIFSAEDCTQLSSVSEIIQRISDILKTVSDRKLNVQLFFNNEPLHDLLSVGSLTRTEIPLDLIDMLISAGYNVNSLRCSGETCLDFAVESCHYNAIRFLAKHGAKSTRMVHHLTILATQPDVPLDLFDLLGTPRNLNLCMRFTPLPLHRAILYGHTATALHLIKLGASVNQRDGWSKLPRQYFVERRTRISNAELVRHILPFDGVRLLSFICEILLSEKPDKADDYLLETLHQLLQRLHFDEALKVKIRYR